VALFRPGGDDEELERLQPGAVDFGKGPRMRNKGFQKDFDQGPRITADGRGFWARDDKEERNKDQARKMLAKGRRR